jgi:alpha-tubulin suppressor-like RCC1 family protein
MNISGALHDVFIAHIAAGNFHSAVVSEAGVLYSWGLDADGQLGHTKDKSSLGSTGKRGGSKTFERKQRDYVPEPQVRGVYFCSELCRLCRLCRCTGWFW